MIYELRCFTRVPEYFDEATNPNAKSDAEAARVAEVAAVLEQEDYRFHIMHHITDEEGHTTWRNLREGDPEEGEYKVFDHTIGKYEDFTNLTDAKARLEEQKVQMINDMYLDTVYEVAEMPSYTKPTIAGAQTF